MFSQKGVCDIKPMDGKTSQMTLWESDQFIVPRKQGNACGGKGLAGVHCYDRETLPILRDGQGVSPKLASITLRVEEVLLKSRMRENLTSGSVRGLYSHFGAITPTRSGL